MEQLTWLSGDFLANRGLQQDSAEGLTMTAISGRRCLELSNKSGQLGLLVKMLLESSTWHSSKCALTWKPKVMQSNRLLFRLAPETLRTDATESGLLPTPTAQDQHNASLPPGLLTWKRKGPDSLCQMLKKQGSVGKLNPKFVEHMMGFPPGWTEV